MSDDKKKKGYQDDTKIDPNDTNELAYRSKAWGVFTVDLLKAIDACGSTVATKVYKELKKMGKV